MASAGRSRRNPAAAAAAASAARAKVTPAAASRKRLAKAAELSDYDVSVFEKFARLEADPALVTPKVAECVLEQFRQAAERRLKTKSAEEDSTICKTFFGQMHSVTRQFSKLPGAAKLSLISPLADVLDVAQRVRSAKECDELERELKTRRGVTCMVCQDDVAVLDPVGHWMYGSSCVHFQRMHRDCLERMGTAIMPAQTFPSQQLAIFKIEPDNLLFAIVDDLAVARQADPDADVERFCTPILLRFRCTVCHNVALRACGSNSTQPGSGLFRSEPFPLSYFNDLAGGPDWTIHNGQKFNDLFFDLRQRKSGELTLDDWAIRVPGRRPPPRQAAATAAALADDRAIDGRRPASPRAAAAAPASEGSDIWDAWDDFIAERIEVDDDDSEEEEEDAQPHTTLRSAGHHPRLSESVDEM